MNIPLSIVAFILIANNFPVIYHHESKRKIDVFGVVLFVLASFPLLYVITQMGTRTILSFDMIAFFVFSAGTLALFLRVEKRSKEPLFSPHFFRKKIFSVSVVASSLGNMAIFGTAIYFPLYLQSVRGESATRSGFIIMPMMVSLILASNLSGFLVSRFKCFKSVAVIGLSASCTGMFCFGFLGETLTIPILIVFSALAGIGLGMTFPIFTVAPQSLFAPQQIGMVTLLLQFFRSLGGTVGSAIFGTLMISHMNAVLKNLSVGQLQLYITEVVKNRAFIANPQKLATIRAGIPESTRADFDKFVSLCIHSMSGSIEMIFLASSGILLAALLMVLYHFNERHVLQAIAEHKKKY